MLIPGEILMFDSGTHRFIRSYMLDALHLLEISASLILVCNFRYRWRVLRAKGLRDFNGYYVGDTLAPEELESPGPLRCKLRDSKFCHSGRQPDNDQKKRGEGTSIKTSQPPAIVNSDSSFILFNTDTGNANSPTSQSSIIHPLKP